MGNRRASVGPGAFARWGRGFREMGRFVGVREMLRRATRFAECKGWGGGWWWAGTAAPRTNRASIVPATRLPVSVVQTSVWLTELDFWVKHVEQV